MTAGIDRHTAVSSAESGRLAVVSDSADEYDSGCHKIVIVGVESRRCISVSMTQFMFMLEHAERGMEGRLLRMRCRLLRTAGGAGISKGSGCGSECQKKWKRSGIQCLVVRFASVLPVMIVTENFQQISR